MTRNFGFTFGRTPEGQRTDYEELEKKLAEQARLKPISPQPQAQPQRSAPTQVNSSDQYWQIPVNYRNGVYTVDLKKSLLDNGNAKTQEDWAKYTEQAKAKGDFYVGDMPLYFSILSAFANATGKDAEEAREFLKKTMRERWLMTLTRIHYAQGNPDCIAHNFGTKAYYQNITDFVGPEGWIKDKMTSKQLEALLGNNDVSKVNNVFQKINGTPAYIWRLNSKPQSDTERVARFVAYSGRADLDCIRDPSVRNVSLGVRVASVASGNAKI